MTAWLGVVSAAHVRRAQELGIAQINHGKRAGLARMHVGGILIYYSPVENMGDREPLRAFTASRPSSNCDPAGYRPRAVGSRGHNRCRR